jgi:hypothetical protein
MHSVNVHVLREVDPGERVVRIDEVPFSYHQLSDARRYGLFGDVSPDIVCGIGPKRKGVGAEHPIQVVVSEFVVDG